MSRQTASRDVRSRTADIASDGADKLSEAAAAGSGAIAATGTRGLPPSAEATVRASAVTGRARRATSAFFLLVGVAMSTWAALVPFAKSRLALSEAALGAILLAFGLGTIVSTIAAAPMIRRYGSHSALVPAGVALSAFLPALALAPSSAWLAALLFVFGVCTGFAGVAANAQAIEVQAASGRPLMSSMHALFSIGGLVGAASISILLKLGLSVEWCAAIVAAALFALVATHRHGLLVRTAGRVGTVRRAAIPPMSVLLVGLMTLSLYLAEGAVLDWGAVFLHDHRGFGISSAALGYAAFSVTMAVSRLLGDRVVARLGPAVVVRFGSLVAATGFAVLILVPGTISGLLGCALIGLGASNVVPTLISASALVSNVPTESAVSTVVAMGTCGLIAGPALIGFAAQATSLPIALFGPVVLLLAVASLAAIVGTRPAAS